MSDETQYGLTGLRDRDGNLNTVEHTYTFAGEQVTIKFDPPTISEQEQLENLDEDEPAGEMERILDDYMVKPSIPEDGSWTGREMWCYLQGIIGWSMGGENELQQEIDDEIAERTGGDEGN